MINLNTNQNKMEKVQYATVAEEGTNYREIADMMTLIGYKMNHSSARNYILRIMKKFAYAITENWEIDVTDEMVETIIKEPKFQEGICDLLQEIEATRKLETKESLIQ